jgi:superfamily II DNA or RNA helicase
MINKILFTDRYIEVTCERNDTDTQNTLMEFYPITRNRIKTNYKLSIHNTPEVLKLLRGLDETNISTAPLAVQNYYCKEMYERNNMTDLVANGHKYSPVVSDNLILKPHQQLGREIALVLPRFAFFYDTRTGKTPLSLAIIADDIRNNPTHKWLVVCPLILIYNAWLDDAPRFFPDIKVVNCHATTKPKRLEAISSEGSIYLTNTESFIRYSEYFDPNRFEGVFVDESSDLKSNKSKVSHKMVEYAQLVKRFYLLSGTPAPNGEFEYYMQMRCLDYFGWQSSYTKFKERYFINMSYEVQYDDLVLRPDRKDELYDAIKRYSMYVDKEDVLDTPGRTFYEVEYDMPAELMKHYRLLKNELYLELGEHHITAASSGVKLNKLNQVSSGFIMDTQARKDNKVYGTDEAEWYLLDDYRFKALWDLLDRPGIKGEQVIIWANYRKEFELIKTMLGDQCVLVYGATSLPDKNKAFKDFKSGAVRYLVANPASADKGLTLVNTHIAVFFSLNWSYELFKQSSDRIYADRSIQPEHCYYYIMLAKHTIDCPLYRDVLQGKKTNSYAVLNHLKSEV